MVFHLLTGVNRFLWASRQLVLLSLMPQCNEKLGGMSLHLIWVCNKMFDNYSVSLFSLSLLFWVSLFSPRQMKSNKLYMHLQLFQTEAYFCSTCFQGNPQAGHGTFCLQEGWYLVVCDLIAVCLQLSVKAVVEFSQRKRLIPWNIFIEPTPPTWCCCAAAAACRWWVAVGRVCAVWVQVLLVPGAVEALLWLGTSPCVAALSQFCARAAEEGVPGSPAFCTGCCEWAVSSKGFCCWLQVPDLALKAKAAPCS